eukprot:140540-Alexandrium_andersonii.AAC.1
MLLATTCLAADLKASRSAEVDSTMSSPPLCLAFEREATRAPVVISNAMRKYSQDMPCVQACHDEAIMKLASALTHEPATEWECAT